MGEIVRQGFLTRQSLWDYRLTPKRIAVAYMVFGAVALYFSDFLLPPLLEQPRLATVQAVKGGIEVIISASLIFVLTNHGYKQVKRSKMRQQRQKGELAVLHRVLRHNLRNDLNVIEANASLVETRSDSAKIHTHCETIQQKVSDTLQYTEHANNIRQVNEGHLTEFELASWIPSIIANHDSIDDSVEVNVDVQEGTDACANTVFEEAVRETITNAIDHNKSETVKIRIEGYVDPEQPGWVVITATDNGTGISDEVWSIIQEGETDQLEHLDGLGLWFVYWTVQESGGRMTISEGDYGGSMIEIRLPRAC